MAWEPIKAKKSTAATKEIKATKGLPWNNSYDDIKKNIETNYNKANEKVSMPAYKPTDYTSQAFAPVIQGAKMQKATNMQKPPVDPYKKSGGVYKSSIDDVLNKYIGDPVIKGVEKTLDYATRPAEALRGVMAAEAINKRPENRFLVKQKENPSARFLEGLTGRTHTSGLESFGMTRKEIDNPNNKGILGKIPESFPLIGGTNVADLALEFGLDPVNELLPGAISGVKYLAKGIKSLTPASKLAKVSESARALEASRAIEPEVAKISKEILFEQSRNPMLKKSPIEETYKAIDNSNSLRLANQADRSVNQSMYNKLFPELPKAKLKNEPMKFSPKKEPYNVSRAEFDARYGLDKDLKGLPQDAINTEIVNSTRLLQQDAGKRIISRVKSSNPSDVVKFYEGKYDLPKINIKYVDELPGNSLARYSQKGNTIEVVKGKNTVETVAIIRHEVEHAIDNKNGFKGVSEAKNRVVSKDNVRDINSQYYKDHFKDYGYFEADYLRKAHIRDALSEGKKVSDEILAEYPDLVPSMAKEKRLRQIDRQLKEFQPKDKYDALKLERDSLAGTKLKQQEPVKSKSGESIPISQENRNPYIDKGIKLNSEELKPSAQPTPQQRLKEIDQLLKEPTEIRSYNNLKQEKAKLENNAPTKSKSGESLPIQRNSSGSVKPNTEVKRSASGESFPIQRTAPDSSKPNTDIKRSASGESYPMERIVNKEVEKPTPSYIKPNKPPVAEKSASKTIKEPEVPDAVSSFKRTVKNSENTDAGLVKEIEKTVPAGYKKSVNQEQWDSARDLVDKNADDIKDKFLMLNKLSGADDTAKGMALVEKYSAEGNFQAANKVLDKLSTLLSKSGQAIQMASVWARRTPEGMLSYVTSVAKRTAEKARIDLSTMSDLRTAIKALDSDLSKPNAKLNMKIYQEKVKALRVKKTELRKIQDRIDKLGHDGTLTTQQSEQIYKDMQASQNMGLSERERLKSMSRIGRVLADLDPVSFRDKFKSLQRMSMLTNVKTAARNVFGNTGLSVVEGAQENTVGAIIDYVLAAKKTGSLIKPLPRGLGGSLEGRNTISAPLGKGVAYAKGFGKGIKETALDTFNDFDNLKSLKKSNPNATVKEKVSALFQDMQKSVDTNPSRSFVELPNKKIWRGNKPINEGDNILKRGYKKTANKVDKVMDFGDRVTALFVNDRPFYQAAYESRMYELKKIAGNKTITPVMEADAKAYALDKVFQNDSKIATVATNVKNKLGLFGDLVMPFTKTPGNIADKILDYTPGGLIKGVVQIGSKNKVFDPKLFTSRVSRTLTGAGLFTLFYKMADEGIITPGKISNSAKEREFEMSKGWQPYSFRIGDKNYSYDWATPVGTIAAIAADFQRSGADKKDVIEQIEAGQAAAVDTFFRQGFLRGVFDMMSGYSPSIGISKSLLGSSTQFQPTLLKQLSKSNDEYERETKSDTVIGGIKNRILSGLPGGQRDKLEYKIDVFGEKIKTPSTFDVFVNPSNSKEISSSPVKKELSRLVDKIKKDNLNIADNTKKKIPTDVLPSVMPDYVDYTDKDGTKRTIDLSPSDVTSYKEQYGKIVDEKLRDLITDKLRTEKTKTTQSKKINYTDPKTKGNQSDDEAKAKLITAQLDQAAIEAKLYILAKKAVKAKIEVGGTSYKTIVEDGYKKPK